MLAHMGVVKNFLLYTSKLSVQKSNPKLVISHPESDSLVTQLGIWGATATWIKKW